MSPPANLSVLKQSASRKLLQQAIAFSNDGLKMFVIGTSNDNINEYTLSAPFTLFGHSFIGATPISHTNNPRDISFSNDGLKMFVVDWSGIQRNIRIHTVCPL